MSYLVIARKYRPQNFASVIGQDAVVRTLKNAILKNKVAHAYLFAGTRGVGKTSAARIFSRALNCLNLVNGEPCGECLNCETILKGTSLGVWEIDGASHNSVDNVRELIETFRSLPPSGYKFKVCIIDEVHMLSTSAFNALLKSLEEPPANTVFILATTEIHKIPETIMSRCQRFDFKNLSVNEIVKCLDQICKNEKIKISDDALYAIARIADGSVRDSQTLLDRVQSFSEIEITPELVAEILGVVARKKLFDLSKNIFEQNSAESLKIIDEIFEIGTDAGIFLREFISHFRELLVGKFGGEDNLKKLGVSPSEISEICKQIAGIEANDLQEIFKIVLSGADSANRSFNPRFAIDALIVRLATRPKLVDFTKFISAISSNSNITLNSTDTLKAVGDRRAEPQNIENSQKKTEKLDKNLLLNSNQAATSVSGKDSTQIPNLQPQPNFKDILTKHSITVADEILEEKFVPSEKLFTNNSSTEYDWLKFIDFTQDFAGPVILEHLKRLTPVKFIQGNLVLKGAEFSLNYFKKAQEKEKLESFLRDYTKYSKWLIEFESTSTGSKAQAEPGSILHIQEQKIEEKKKNQSDELMNHPNVRSLQKVFPGSKIERIKVQE